MASDAREAKSGRMNRNSLTEMPKIFFSSSLFVLLELETR